MGLRGTRAKTAKSRSLPKGRQAWEKPGLSRQQRVMAFCEDMMVTSGPDAGQKFVLRDWQREFIRAVYGCDRYGNRQVRTAILSVGRKCGKTTLAAILAMCHLSGPESERRGEVYACANDRFQATKIFNEMVALIEAHPYLTERTNIQRFRKDIEDVFNKSIYSTLSAEAKTKMGLSPSFCICDELGQATSRELYDTMDSAMGGRKEPLLMVISTQAADNFAPLSQLIDYGIKVRDGDLDDPSFHLTLYTAPEDADPWAEETWHKANPALGDFRSLEDVRRMAQQAQRIPSQENAFRNLILNQRVAAEARFMEPTLWKQCGAPAQISFGDTVYAGLDLGSTRDLSAFVVVRIDEHGDAHVEPHVWVPGDLRARSDEEGVPYDVWGRQGVVLAAGEATDPRAIAIRIAEINGRTPIKGIAVDRWRIAEYKRELDAIGCAAPLIPHGQGFRDMSPAVDLLERMIVQKRLRHGNNPILTWCAYNAVVTRDPAGNRKFDKSNTKYKSRIDALVALAMGLRAAFTKEKPVVFDVEALIA
jgi:phage terminase large subunit-like protein